VKHVPIEFWASWNAQLRKAGSRFLLGELLDGDPSVVASTWSQGGFDAMFDFPLGFAMGDVFCKGASPATLGAILTNDRRYPEPSSLVTLVDNHDLPRIMSTCGGDEAKVRAALAFLLTARGIPSLAWGTEVGLTGAKEPDNRRSMAFTPHPLRAEIANWLERRRNNPALSDGAVIVLNATRTGIAIGRVTESQLAIVRVGDVPLPSWPDAVGAAFIELGSAANVRVSVTKVEAGRWRALAGSATRQWRTGEQRVKVSFSGPPGTFVVGSGPELGDWNPQRAMALPATVELPRHGVFEFKGLRRDAKGADVTWARTGNGLLFVEQPVTVPIEAVE
jgi:hypothetical protein